MRTVLKTAIFSAITFLFVTVAEGQSISIMGVNVPTKTVNQAYAKALESHVFGGNMQHPVSERDYIKAWDEYKKMVKNREREKERRERESRDAARRGQSYTPRRTSSSSISVNASAGFYVRDEKKPEFIDVEAVVVRPGRSSAIIRSDDGELMIVESRSVLTKTGKPRKFKLKRDPKGQTQTIRQPNTDPIELDLYQDFTLSPADFVKYVRRGELASLIPELKRATTSGFARGTPKTSTPRKLGSSGSNLGRGDSRFGSGGSGLSGSGGLNQRSGSGFSSRTTKIKR